MLPRSHLPPRLHLFLDAGLKVAGEKLKTGLLYLYFYLSPTLLGVSAFIIQNYLPLTYCILKVYL